MHILVRAPGAAFRDALSEHPDRRHIDAARAVRQHAAFVTALGVAPGTLTELAVEPGMPDATFVSDTLVALPRAGGAPGGRTALLVATRPAAPSRQPEVASVVAAAVSIVGTGVPIVEIAPTETLEGGDVIVFGTRIAIGVSARTTRAGARRLADAAAALGYRPFLCPVTDRLHLATAVTVVRPDLLIGTAAGFASLDGAGPACAPVDQVQRILLPDAELAGANVLVVGTRAIVAAGNPTASLLLAERGLTVVEVDLGQFTLADGGPTCLVNVIP